jgi:hypothetical protein
MFLLLSIQSYLATYSLREFRMSFWRLGPTELRLFLILGNLAAYRWPMFVKDRHIFDFGGAVGIVGMFVILVWFTARNIMRLYDDERLC